MLNITINQHKQLISNLTNSMQEIIVLTRRFNHFSVCKFIHDLFPEAEPANMQKNSFFKSKYINFLNKKESMLACPNKKLFSRNYRQQNCFLQIAVINYQAI